MNELARFREEALASGVPGDEITRFLEHLRLTIRLSGGPDGEPVGRFGGTPRLPVGVPWPSGGDGPLPFVFSVDCAALPKVEGSGLPVDGSLLFFLDHEGDLLDADSRKHARVVRVPAGAEVEDAAGAGPGGEAYEVSASLLAELPGWFEPEDDEDDLSPAQEQLERDLPHLEELRALADDRWPPDDGLASAYLGGHVDDEVMTSIAEQTLAGRDPGIPVGKWYSAVDREKHRLAGEWLTLARFATADDLYSGSFVIRYDDLAAGRLDRALSVTTFSE